MITTGNLYIQVYDSIQNKYVELPFNQLKILTEVRTGEALNYLNFSGFSISKDLKVTSNIENFPILLGYGNLASGFGGNIGLVNQNFHFPNDALYAGLNIGNVNILKSGYSSYNLGFRNKLINTDDSHAIGSSNEINPISYSPYNRNISVIGVDNILLHSGDSVYIYGVSNSASGIFNNNSLIGNFNSFYKIINSSTVGKENIGSDSENINIFGNSNILNKTNNALIVGSTNTILNSNEIIAVGTSNQITGNSLYLYSFGDGNNINDASNSTIIGQTNSISGGDKVLVLGNLNIASFESGAGSSNIIGRANIFNGFVDSINVIGSTNISSGVFYECSIFGEENYIENTSNLLINGNNNLISNSDFIYGLGTLNETVNSLNNVFIGNSNIINSGLSSFVIGTNNSVSGFQNYIFGNNNIVRSGDYNSILIGISHEFTGDYKAASVNIASVDSSIEVAPSEIKLTSPSRAKFNNENIVVNSDLSNYLNSSNGLANSGVFTSYVINDPSYNNLSAQIELQSFAYSGTEDRYYGGFSGFNSNNLNAYNFTGFFRKQPALYYNGLHSIYGNNYYQSNDENFEILFSRDIEPIIGNWILSPKESQGLLFYNPSTNTGVFPTSNWLVTGSSVTNITGHSPAPSFTYSSSFTGFFQKQKINSSTTYTSNYFNNFGGVLYSSIQGEDVAVIYGNHTNPQFDPTWLIIDKYSSGVYYINNAVSISSTPQTGWVATGYMGYTGRNPEDLDNAIFNTGIKISLGTRSGIVSSYDPTYGKIYIPFFY